MKRQLILLLFSLLLFPAMMLAQTGQPTFLETFKPVERVHNFGTILERNGKVQYTFVLENKGKKTVAISNVNTWCGCVVADYTKSGIRPGEKAHVNVTFDPDHKNGNFVKQVVLLLNGGSQYVRLWIKANVVPYQHPVKEDYPYYFGHGLYMSQELLPFPQLNEGDNYSFDLGIANDTNKPMKIVFKRTPNNTVLKMPSTLTLKPKERTTVKVSYHFYHKYTQTRFILVTPVINGKNGKPLRIQWNGGQKFKLGI